MLCTTLHVCLLLISRLNESLASLERKLKITRRWEPSEPDFVSTLKAMDKGDGTHLLSTARAEAKERLFLISLKMKYPDGQAIAIKLSNQIKQSNRRIAKAIKTYNTIKWPPQHSYFPCQHGDSHTTPLHLSTLAWMMNHPAVCESDPVPVSLKRRAVDALNRKDQTLEESQMLHKEMRAVLNYLHLQHDLAKNAVEYYHQPGLRSALIHQAAGEEVQLSHRHDLPVHGSPTE
ncbi:hypothetical protein SKAU_G00279700 [Synaphobranchus kaupii]|uniref:Uncharacterized protein n=1 Tax=Synaphobranchus kaupii TaxID=118154 RepID=A0A9Q1IMW7_SYNKA|nr:hypothetical protein SKAU_G00279700 [Synaphobranchus kaupii]